jgi:hypothetical protein
MGYVISENAIAAANCRHNPAELRRLMAYFLSAGNSRLFSSRRTLSTARGGIVKLTAVGDNGPVESLYRRRRCNS